MVEVDDHHQSIQESLFDNPFHSLKKCGINRVWVRSRGIGGPTNGNPDRTEALGGNQLEIALIQSHPPLAFLRRFERIAQIDAGAHRPIDGVGFVCVQRRTHSTKQ